MKILQCLWAIWNKTYHSTSYKHNNFKNIRKPNHQTSITLTSQANRKRLFDKDSIKLSEYSFSKPVTGVETYYKEILRKPAKFEICTKQLSVFSSRKRSQMKSNEIVWRREPLMQIKEERRNLHAKKIFKDYSKILNYSDKLNEIFSRLPFRQM